MSDARKAISPAYAHFVVQQIAEYAEEIACQAGVGSLETAGQIVSFLWERPSLMAEFMTGSLSVSDSGMLDLHNGVLSWHGQDGNIHRPDPSKARFPAPQPEPQPVAGSQGEFVLVPRVPTTAMTLAFHEASPHRPTGWTAEDAWAAMLGAAAARNGI